jgi:hypothetical protein
MVPPEAHTAWGWLATGCGAVAVFFMFFVGFRARTHRRAGKVALVCYVLLFLYCFMQWAAWYE